MRKFSGTAVGVAAVTILLMASSAMAANWTGTGGDGLWSTNTNWSGNTLPTIGKVYVGYTSGPVTGTVTADASTNWDDSADSLNGPGLFIGTYKGTVFTLNQTGGTIKLPNGTSWLGGATANGLQTAGGSGTWNISGGTAQITKTLFIGNAAGANGLLDYSGGSLVAKDAGGDVISICSGDNSGATGTLAIRGNSTLTLAQATSTTTKSNIRLGGVALGTPAGNENATVKLGDAASLGTIAMAENGTSPWYVYGGINNASTAPNNNFAVQGVGAVTVSGFGQVSGSPGSFGYMGKIIADGWGANADRTLDLTGTPYYAVGAAAGALNVNNWGFYAQNRATLVLAPATLASGSNKTSPFIPGLSTSSNLTAIAPINAVQGIFASIGTGNTMQVKLLATDVSTLPTPSGFAPISVYQFIPGGTGNFSSTTLQLQFRYDNVAMTAAGKTPADLGVWAYNGSTWSQVGLASASDPSKVGLDLTNEFLTTTSISGGSTAFGSTGYFAVGVVPEPATMAMLILGGIGMLARRRK